MYFVPCRSTKPLTFCCSGPRALADFIVCSTVDLLFEVLPQSEGRSSKTKVSSSDRSEKQTSKQHDELAPQPANAMEVEKK